MSKRLTNAQKKHLLSLRGERLKEERLKLGVSAFELSRLLGLKDSTVCFREYHKQSRDEWYDSDKDFSNRTDTKEKVLDIVVKNKTYTLHQVGEALGISRQRVSQILKKMSEDGIIKYTPGLGLKYVEVL